jgi:glucose-6-phosphate isomerase
LSQPQIHEGVKILYDMLGCMNKMKYVEHYVTYMGKFPKFMLQIYMESKGPGPSGDPILVPKQWIIWLYNTLIMNLLEIPHFGR